MVPATVRSIVRRAPSYVAASCVVLLVFAWGCNFSDPLASGADSGDESPDIRDLGVETGADTGGDSGEDTTMGDDTFDAIDTAEGRDTGDATELSDSGDTSEPMDTGETDLGPRDTDGTSELGMDTTDGGGGETGTGDTRGDTADGDGCLTYETCNGVDDDCDGAIDEGCNCTYDPTESDNVDTDNSNDSGVCTGQTRDASGVCQAPSDYDSTDDESSAGLCDGKDNDCDGAIDEGCSCTYDPTEPDSVDTDSSNDSGVCPGQTRDPSGTCQTPVNFESTESSCSDGLDNDCDGATDSKDADCTVGSGAPGEACNSDSDCDNGPCVSNGSSQVCAHTMFMTSNEYSPDQGSLSDLDSICQNLATNAGFSGTWQVVASSSSASAKGRTTVSAPIYNTAGSRVADDATDLWDGSIQNGLNFDETGGKYVGSTVYVRTGTLSDGSSSGTDCSDWTSSSSSIDGTYGDAKSTNASWIDGGSTSCSFSDHIYCIDGQ